jgi:hypothetical protein
LEIASEGSEPLLLPGRFTAAWEARRRRGREDLGGGQEELQDNGQGDKSEQAAVQHLGGLPGVGQDRIRGRRDPQCRRILGSLRIAAPPRIGTNRLGATTASGSSATLAGYECRSGRKSCAGFHRIGPGRKCQRRTRQGSSPPSSPT